MSFSLVLFVVTAAASVLLVLYGASGTIRSLLGRGEVADVADEQTRALIDGDTPLPVAEAALVNQAFAGLINSDLRELRRVDQDLERFYVIGDER